MNSLAEFIRLTGLKLHGLMTNVADWVGHGDLKAQMTLWIITLAQETDARNGYGGEMCKRTPQPSTETGPCTFAIVQFGRVHENEIFIDNQIPQTHTSGLSRKLLRDSAQGSAPKLKIGT